MSKSDVRYEIAIYWDYENVPLPDGYNAAVAAKAIVDAVSSYGRIVDRRLYFDFQRFTKFGPQDSSSLDSSGFDLVNTPTRNQKETLDKKLIADVLTFAWDSAVRNDNIKPCVVLLTSDGDYAYTLSKLRDRGVMTIVMVGKGCTVASILLDTADVSLSLEHDVLAKNTNSVKATTGATHGDEGSFLKTLCRIVGENQSNSEDKWIDFGSVSSLLQQRIRKESPNVDYKEHAKSVKKEAETQNLIETGRRKLQTAGGKRIIVSSSNKQLHLSNEVYVRLLPSGEQLAGLSSKTSEAVPTETPPFNSNRKYRTVFVPLLPRDTLASDFVGFLQDTYHVTVYRALLEPGPKHSNAHVEFDSQQDSSRLIKEANKTVGKGVYYKGKSLGIIPNTRYSILDQNHTNDELYFVSASTKHLDYAKAPTPRHDAVTDSRILCVCVYEATRLGSNGWVGGGAVGVAFRAQLPKTFLQTTPKEGVTLRFKEARQRAILDGLAETGKRKLDSPNIEYVTVSPNFPSLTSERLSPEDYIRLLPAGRTEAENTEQNPRETVTASPSGSSTIGKCIFSSNFPPHTTAKEVVDFIEGSIPCSVERAELHEGDWKGECAIIAHVQLASTKEVSQILLKSKQTGLICHGQRIFMTPNRTTPDAIALKIPNNPECMKFIRQPESHDTEVESDFHDPQEASSTPTIEFVLNSEDPFGLLGSLDFGAENCTTLQKKDPFEDLIWS
jgi:hypothetical protein